MRKQVPSRNQGFPPSSHSTNQSLTVLLDTNILVKLADNESADSQLTAIQTTLSKIEALGGRVLVHAAQIRDIRRASGLKRKRLESLYHRYPVLRNAPGHDAEFDRILGRKVNPFQRDVDDLLLLAVYAKAVNLLLTLDATMLQDAAILGIDSSVQKPGNADLSIHHR